MMYRSLMIAGLAATAALEGLGAMHEDLPMRGGKGFAGGETCMSDQEPTNTCHTSKATRLSKPLQNKLGVLRLEGWGNPQSTGTGVEDPEHATPGHPYTGYVPLPGDVDAMQGQLRRL